jgi:hypothetical protein
VYVFTESGGLWTQQVKLTAAGGSAGDNLGQSVSIYSGNLNHETDVVAGAPGANSGAGAAYAYSELHGDWSSHRTVELLASDGAAGDGFGTSVSNQYDAVAVGAPDNSPGAVTNAGAAYVFTADAFTGQSWWNATGPDNSAFKLTAAVPHADDHLGASVSLDANSVAAGIPGYQGQTGAVAVFTEPGGQWANGAPEALFTAAGGQPGDQLGY